MAVLVVAEHDQKTIAQSTLSTITAATQLSDKIDLLVMGKQPQTVVEQAKTIQGVSKVLVADGDQYEHFLAEDLAATILAQATHYDYLLAPATTFGKNVMPRVAATLDVAQVSDIIEIISKDTFKRPIYAGAAIATVQSKDAKKVITVRPTAFLPAEISSHQAEVENIQPAPAQTKSRFVKHDLTKSDRPELTAAKIVISGGRGLQNKENFQIIERLADRLGAAVGASRAAVDAGFVPNDYQVGQTGKVVAPDLYIAIGISGAVQHVAGIKDAKIIVAINKDPDAPIFEVADYGLVADFFEILPDFEKKLDELGYK